MSLKKNKKKIYLFLAFFLLRSMAEVKSYDKQVDELKALVNAINSVGHGMKEMLEVLLNIQASDLGMQLVQLTSDRMDIGALLAGLYQIKMATMLLINHQAELKDLSLEERGKFMIDLAATLENQWKTISSSPKNE